MRLTSISDKASSFDLSLSLIALGHICTNKCYYLLSFININRDNAHLLVTQNVPRNNQLAEYSDETYWAQDYLISWVNWNTFRGVCASVSAVLGALSLTLMRR